MPRLFLLLLAATAFAQNPYTRDPEAIEAGKSSYLALCAGCHGTDARGSRGPNLYSSKRANSPDAAGLFDVVKNGIPGTEMIPLGIDENDAWRIVAYLHSVVRPGTQAALRGDPVAGEKVFEATGCGRCHMIDGRGGLLGPDLSGIAAERRPEAIRASILDPSRRITAGFENALIIDQRGRKFNGLIKNEDNFSIQLLTTTLRLVSLDRPGLRALDRKSTSLMPANYSQRISSDEFENLLAFLDRRRKPTLHYERGFGNY